MKNDSIGSIILAAGKGTRFKSDVPKVMAPLLGRKLIDYITIELSKFAQNKEKFEYGFVLGHQKELVQSWIEHKDSQQSQSSVSSGKLNFAIQKEQLGTANAVSSFLQQFKHYQEMEYVFIMCGDTPLLHQEIFEKLFLQISQTKANAIVASFEVENPHGYGRIDRGEEGIYIVEQKECNKEQNLIQEVNSGLYIVKSDYLFSQIEKVNRDNKAGEFYLTDLFSGKDQIEFLNFGNTPDFSGINTLVQLSQARKILIERINLNWMNQGVDILDPERTIIEPSVNLSSGVVLYPNCHLRGETSIEANAVIEDGCIVINSKVGSGTKLLGYSYLENAEVGGNASIGPFARLRPGAKVAEECKIGNFVEIKKADLKKGSKVSHLSYVGDAEIGEGTNIGCGFITCNYDGANKHVTKIGANSFIGSDVQTIAPVEIGENTYIGSGSTINKNVPDGAFAIARERQVTKEGMAKKFLKTKTKK